MTLPLMDFPAANPMWCARCRRNISAAHAVGKYGPACAKKLGLTAAKTFRPRPQGGPDLFDTTSPENPDAAA